MSKELLLEAKNLNKTFKVSKGRVQVEPPKGQVAKKWNE